MLGLEVRCWISYRVQAKNAAIPLTWTHDLLGSHKKQHDLVLVTPEAGAERTFREIWTGNLAEKKMLICAWKHTHTIVAALESSEETSRLKLENMSYVLLPCLSGIFFLLTWKSPNTVKTCYFFFFYLDHDMSWSLMSPSTLGIPCIHVLKIFKKWW